MPGRVKGLTPADETGFFSAIQPKLESTVNCGLSVHLKELIIFIVFYFVICIRESRCLGSVD